MLAVLKVRELLCRLSQKRHTISREGSAGLSSSCKQASAPVIPYQKSTRKYFCH